MPDDTRPAMLILGGLSTVSRHLVAYLCGDEGEILNPSAVQTPLVKYLRIADRFSVQPATTSVVVRACRECDPCRSLSEFIPFAAIWTVLSEGA